MFNIAIEQLPGKYLYVSHNNPTINTALIVGNTLSKFRFEKEIDPDLFVSQLILNLAKLDSKKSPVFHLGVSSILGENSGFIIGVSFPHGKIGAFNEDGTCAHALYDTLEFAEYVSRGGIPANAGRGALVRSENPPASFNFSGKISALL